MKNKLALFSCVGILFIGTLYSFKLESNTDVVMIRVYESIKNIGYPSKIVIDGAETKVIELEDDDFKSPEKNKNAVLIKQALKSYLDEGYKIETCVTVGTFDFHLTTYTLLK